MIHSVAVKNAKLTPCPWWADVEGLKGRKTFRFKPGLNILWGRNGTGKSTVLTALARYFHCEQGGRSVITTTSCREICDTFAHDEKNKWKTGLKVEHDGQTVFYINPGKAVGLMGGAFDDDFFQEGITNTMMKGSAGQTTLMRTQMTLDHLKKSKGKIEDRIGENVNDLWLEIRAKVLEMLKATVDEKGPLTILLDEPDRSIDLDYARQLWDILPIVARERQVIVATHHPFAIRLDEKPVCAHYIELGNKDYRTKCKDLFPTKGAE